MCGCRVHICDGPDVWCFFFFPVFRLHWRNGPSGRCNCKWECVRVVKQSTAIFKWFIKTMWKFGCEKNTVVSAHKVHATKILSWFLLKRLRVFPAAGAVYVETLFREADTVVLNTIACVRGIRPVERWLYKNGSKEVQPCKKKKKMCRGS